MVPPLTFSFGRWKSIINTLEYIFNVEYINASYHYLPKDLVIHCSNIKFSVTNARSYVRFINMLQSTNHPELPKYKLNTSGDCELLKIWSELLDPLRGKGLIPNLVSFLNQGGAILVASTTLLYAPN